jgi:hypothetical protein
LSNEEISHVITFDFDIPKDATENASIDYQFTNHLSLEEPYFFVQADDLCFVSDIVIDYSEIAPKLKGVWTASFIGNIGARIEHDETAHRIVARVDGALMPGQGVVLVWEAREPIKQKPKQHHDQKSASHSGRSRPRS